jgi:hypothetical protein
MKSQKPRTKDRRLLHALLYVAGGLLRLVSALLDLGR